MNILYLINRKIESKSFGFKMKWICITPVQKWRQFYQHSKPESSSYFNHTQMREMWITESPSKSVPDVSWDQTFGAALRAIAPKAGAMPERRSQKSPGATAGAALRKTPERWAERRSENPEKTAKNWLIWHRQSGFFPGHFHHFLLMWDSWVQMWDECQITTIRRKIFV